jgi:hypothetical protein
MEADLRAAKKERCLARRLAAMTQHDARVLAEAITAIKLADAIVAQSGELANRESAGFVANQPQRQIQTLPISRIAIV